MPDEAEIVAGAAKGTAEGLIKPFSDLLAKLLGPAAEEVGLTLKDSVQVWRKRRRIRLFQRLEAFIHDAGFDPIAVSPKILLASLDWASVEDDDCLQDRWAALLANAADPRQRQDKLIIHVSVLKELSAGEVRFLDTLYDYVIERLSRGIRPGAAHGLGWEVEMDFILKQSHQEEYFDISFIDNLERLNLIRRSTEQNIRMNTEAIKVPGAIEETFYFTELAFGLVEACRPPIEEI